jgi:tetratricopeptide (TPR) repeat protein
MLGQPAEVVDLRPHIEAIQKSVTHLTLTAIVEREAPEVYHQPFQPLIDNEFVADDKAELHRHVCSRALRIQSILSSKPSTSSIQEAGCEMLNLSIAFSNLGMPDDAAKVGHGTVNLFRTLVRSYPDVFSPHLIHSLRILSDFHMQGGEFDAASQAIIESVSISRQLQAPTGGGQEELKVQLASSLMTLAKVLTAKGEHGKSLSHAREAVNILDDVIFGEADKEFNRERFLGIASKRSISVYARALYTLACSLENVGLPANAAEVGTLSLEAFSIISPLYPNGLLQVEIAAILAYLATQGLRPFVTTEDALSHCQQSETIYRSFSVRMDRKQFAKPLCDVLWEKATILEALGKDQEALDVWKEMTSMAKEFLEDPIYISRALSCLSRSFRRLNINGQAAFVRLESAKIYQAASGATSSPDAEAVAYYDIAVDFYLAKSYQDASGAAEKSVMHYRNLSSKYPGQFTKQLALSLNFLTFLLVKGDNYERSSIEGHETLKVYEVLIRSSPEVLPEYFYALEINLSVAEYLNDEMRAIERVEYVLGVYQELVKQYPAEEWRLADARSTQARILNRHDRLQEAVSFNQQAIAWHERNSPNRADATLRYVRCLIEQASILNHLGFSAEAFEPIQKAIEIGRPFSSDSPEVASATTGAMYRCAQILCEMGRDSEAMTVSTDAVSFARQTPLGDIGDLVGCLQVAAFSHIIMGHAEKSVELAKEGVEICRSDSMKEKVATSKYHLRYLPQCLQILSECFADAGDESQALAFAQEAVDETQKLKAEHPKLPWSAVEEMYICSLVTLSIRLLANDKATLGLEHIVEAKDLCKTRSEKRNGIYTILANVLRTNAICYCALGMHGEGIATRAELNDLRNRLQQTFPSLANLVEIESKRDISRRSWVTLLAKVQLQCHHQDEGKESY